MGWGGWREGNPNIELNLGWGQLPGASQSIVPWGSGCAVCVGGESGHGEPVQGSCSGSWRGLGAVLERQDAAVGFALA